MLARVVSEVFHEAGVSAAGVSQLFEAGVDEKIIRCRLGHRSTDALTMYEHVTPPQQQAVSNILTSAKKEYRDEMQVISAQASLCLLHIPAQFDHSLQ